ncbi:MAG: hypothetical protein ABJC74_03635 [Gemmatimonadota bacterium]
MQHVDQLTLDAVISHSLSEAQVARIKEHVRVCRVCARRLEEYRDLFSEVEIIIPTAERDVMAKPEVGRSWREVIRPRFDDALPSGDKAIKIGAGIVTVLVIGVVIFLMRSPAQTAGPIVLAPSTRTPATAPVSTAAPTTPAPTGGLPTTPAPAVNPPARTTATLGPAAPARIDLPKPTRAPVATAPAATTPRRSVAAPLPAKSAVDGASTAAAPSGTPPKEGGHTPLFHRIESAEALSALGGSIRLIDGTTPDHFEMAPGNVVPGAEESLPVIRVIYKLSGATILLDQQRHPEISSRGLSSGTAPEGVSVVQWSSGDFWLTLAGRVPADTLELLARRVH